MCEFVHEFHNVGCGKLGFLHWCNGQTIASHVYICVDFSMVGEMYTKVWNHNSYTHLSGL
jgi:hypothetical protein